MPQIIQLNDKTTQSSMKRGLSQPSVKRVWSQPPVKRSLSQFWSRTRRIIRHSIIVLCISGLLYQTIELFVQFSGRETSRETVVNIKVEKNKYNSIPAITICYPAMVSMESTAQMYPELRPLFDEYKNRMKNVSENDYKNEIFVKQMNHLYKYNVTTLAIEKSNVKELYDLSIPFNFYLTDDKAYDPLSSIRMVVDGIRLFSNGSVDQFDIEDKTPVHSIAFDKYGSYKKCFTFFSHLNKTFRQIEIDVKSIVFWVYDSDNWYPPALFYFDTLDDYRISFSMHSPNAIPNRMNDNNFLHLKVWNRYHFSYNRWKTVLLPPPYQTNCRDYNLDDKHDFRLRSDCVNHCIYDGLSRECADPSIDKTYDWTDCLEKTDLIWKRESFNDSLGGIKICEDIVEIMTAGSSLSEQDPLAYEGKLGKSRCRRDAINKISTDCEVKCQPECVNRFYNYDLKSQTPRLASGKWTKSTYVKIVHNQMPDQIVENKPEMTFITFAAGFGGLSGMWLGLSVLTILHYFIDALK